MGKAGRPNKYESNVKPRFAEIKEWLKAGATDKEIAENLGVNPKVFCKYKNEFNELNELIKNSRLKAVQEIKAALFKRATGMRYSEKKTVKFAVEFPKYIKSTLDECGIDTSKLETLSAIKIEEYDKYALPDPASAMILLKHWDKDTEWTQDPATLKLKKEELELKKQHAELERW